MKFNLKKIPKPSGRSKNIKDWILSEENNSLFDKGVVKGWWPVAGKPKKKDREKDAQTGKKSDKLVLTVRSEIF